MSKLGLVAEDLLSLLEDRVEYWRGVYASEIENGPPRRNRVSPSKLPRDLAECERPFFAKLNPEDPHYIRAFRTVELAALEYNLSSKVVIMRLSGYRLGVKLVEEGIVRDLDDFPLALALFKVGLADVVDESLNRMRVNIYECMSCYGLPNIGRTMCDFEAGVLQGVLTKLYGENVVRERYCWGLGYSFCVFDVFFE